MSRTTRLMLMLLAVLIMPRFASGDFIHFRNGNSIEVETWRRAGNSVEYYRFGGLVSVPSADVARIDSARTETSVSPPMTLPGGAETGEPADSRMLQRALQELSAGKVDSFVSHFRYVDDPKWPDERAGLTRILSLLRDRLGRPDGFQPASSTSPRFLTVWIEPATPDEWRRSDCLFKGYAFKTALVDEKTRRPAELIVEMCQAQATARSWIRKVDFHFLEPDPKIIQTMQEVAQAMQAAAARRP